MPGAAIIVKEEMRLFFKDHVFEGQSLRIIFFAIHKYNFFSKVIDENAPHFFAVVS